MITNCSKTNISLEDLINLQQFGQILSLIGSCSLVPLLVTKLIVPKFRLFPSRMSTLFVLASLGLNITILTGRSQNWEQLWLGKLNHEAPTQFCIIQGFFFQFFAAAIIMLWLCIALCMYFVLVGKKSFEEVQTHETMMHVFWLGGSLLMTGIPSLLHNAVPQLGTSYCWLTDDNYFAYQIAFFHSEMFGSLFVGSILLYKVVRKLAKVSDLGDDDFVSLVRSYVLRNILNVLAFAFVFVVIVVFVINQILDRHDMKATNTFFRIAGPTFDLPTGACSAID